MSHNQHRKTRLSSLWKCRGLAVSLALACVGFIDHSWGQEVGLDDGEHLPKLQAQLGFDGNLSSGNLEQIRLSGRGSLFWRQDDLFAVTNQMSYSFMKNGDLKFSDDFRDVGSFVFKPLSRIIPYALLLYHQSFTRFIDRRWMAGLGGAFSALRSKSNQLKIGVVGAYEWTRLDGRPPPFTPPDGFGVGCLYKDAPSSPRSCDRQMWRVIPRLVGHHEVGESRLLIDYEVLWVVDPLKLEDERVFVALTATSPITQWLSLYGHFDLSFESIVLKHREKLDRHISFGLKVNFRE